VHAEPQEPHGYIRESEMHVGLDDLIEVAAES
jgi:hypothetical protein